MSATVSLAALDRAALRELVTTFLFEEARLADESRYEEWLALWAEDLHYWVPAGAPTYDRDRRISFINDNRNRLQTRIRQLQTGVRYAQTPPSPMRRLVGNIELLDVTGDEVRTGSNFVLHELSAQATNELRIWAGRTTHVLRAGPDGLRMVSKVVELVNAEQPLPNLAFLL